VEFAAEGSGATRCFWTFGDGTFSTAASPRKTFHVSGVYKVHLTALDASGRWTRASVPIRVGPG
jgi:PKD repeat protein